MQFWQLYDYQNRLSYVLYMEDIRLKLVLQLVKIRNQKRENPQGKGWTHTYLNQEIGGSPLIHACMYNVQLEKVIMYQNQRRRKHKLSFQEGDQNTSSAIHEWSYAKADCKGLRTMEVKWTILLLQNIVLYEWQKLISETSICD